MGFKNKLKLRLQYFHICSHGGSIALENMVSSISSLGIALRLASAGILVDKFLNTSLHGQQHHPHQHHRHHPHAAIPPDLPGSNRKPKSTSASTLAN
jgi:hypothetical protein